MPRTLLCLIGLGCLVLSAGCGRESGVTLSGKQEAVSVAKRPFRLSPSLKPGRVVVSCFAAKTVQELSLAPLAVTATLQVLTGPQDLILDPYQSMIYCLHTQENVLAILGGEPLRVKRQVKTGGLTLAGAALKPHTGHLWICDGTTGVSVFGFPCACLQRRFPVGRYPQAVLFTSADEAWVTLKGENAVVVLDTATQAEKHRITVGIYPGALLLAGNTVCVANAGSNDVSLIDRAQYKERARVRVPKQPQALAVQGKTLWVASSRSFHLAAVDVARGRLIGTLRTGFYPGDILALADGSLVVTAPDKNQVVRITPELPSSETPVQP
jgi:YVTN family beta-propeller protein